MEKKPNEVLNLEKKLENKKIWFNTSNNYKNKEAGSCWDAALKRNRLGHPNIPIFCELKSNFGFIIKNNKKKYVMVHCRGNQKIDREKVNKITGVKCQKMDKIELNNLGLRFGLVNPFFGFDRTDILQIFDESLMTQDFIPNTMMTNASHSRWGIEFKIDELISSLPNKLINDVIIENTKFKITKHKIGILTGNSPESGMLLWEKINDRIRNNLINKNKNYFLGDISYPEVIIESNPGMGLSMELDKRYEDVKEVVKKGIINLCERGATIVCIACNTTQCFSEISKEICSKHKADYVSIPETTYDYLMSKEITKFDFIGINHVSDFEKWSAFENLKNDFHLYLPNKKNINEINDLAYKVKKNSATVQELYKINKSSKTNCIVLALTELSILFKSVKNKNKSGKVYCDTLTILAEAIGDKCTKDYISEMEKLLKIRDGERRYKKKNSQ